MLISFIVEGAAVPQARPRFSRFGNAIHTYDTKTCRDYKELVGLRAKEAMQGREPTDAPIMVMIDCRFTPPASWPKYKREAAIRNGWQTAKNDVDNLAKSILDGATGVIWGDDSQVVGLVVTKRYDVIAKTLVTVIEPDKNRSPIWTVAHMMRNFKFLEAGIN